MKIHVLIPSRERPKMLAATLETLRALETGAHTVRYTVLADSDDAPTLEMAGRTLDVEHCAGAGLVNARVNGLIAESDADAFMPWADDLFALAPAWDEITKRVLDKVPAFSWQEIQDPRNHTAIVLSAAWVKAAGRFFPEHFPFWFADTWLKEVHGFVYGRDMPIIEQLRFFHKRGATHGMRDLAFWFTIFARTRGERVAEAKRIAAALGLSWRERPELVAIFEAADAEQLNRVPQYEAAFGAVEGGEPSAEYLKAKRKAEAMLRPQNAFAEAA